VPIGRPQPLHASQPFLALYAPFVPLVMSWNALVELLLV
jgi:hypothetical protein